MQANLYRIFFTLVLNLFFSCFILTCFFFQLRRLNRTDTLQVPLDMSQSYLRLIYSGTKKPKLRLSKTQNIFFNLIEVAHLGVFMLGFIKFIQGPEIINTERQLNFEEVIQPLLSSSSFKFLYEKVRIELAPALLVYKLTSYGWFLLTFYPRFILGLHQLLVPY